MPPCTCMSAAAGRGRPHGIRAPQANQPDRRARACAAHPRVRCHAAPTTMRSADAAPTVIPADAAVRGHAYDEAHEKRARTRVCTAHACEELFGAPQPGVRGAPQPLHARSSTARASEELCGSHRSSPPAAWHAWLWRRWWLRAVPVACSLHPGACTVYRMRLCHRLLLLLGLGASGGLGSPLALTRGLGGGGCRALSTGGTGRPLGQLVDGGAALDE